ncbi:hypothetical protein GCM10027289_24300 [Tsukamurella serpentis]
MRRTRRITTTSLSRDSRNSARPATVLTESGMDPKGLPSTPGSRSLPDSELVHDEYRDRPTDELPPREYECPHSETNEKPRAVDSRPGVMESLWTPCGGRRGT